MKRHKWYNEIVAWAIGADIEYTYDDISTSSYWITALETPNWNCELYKFRIKPQPKEPQYLYVYKRLNGGNICFSEKNNWCQKTFLYLGKIKLEVDDE